MLELILDAKADINIQDSNGWTALHHSAFKGDAENVRVLIENECNINIASNNGRTAMHMAVIDDQVEVLEILLEKKNSLF